MHDVIVIGGGFAGVTAAREVALAGRSALLLEAKDRLGGRTWTADWNGQEIEYGGGWVHWHQPHAWSEMTRGGVGGGPVRPRGEHSWWVGGERRSGTAAERDAIAERGWNRFVAGSEEALPNPYTPLDGGEAMARFDRQTIARAHRRARARRRGARGAAGRVRVARARVRARGGRVRACVRWHVLSGSSLELTQYTGGRVTIQGGTRTLLNAIAGGAQLRDAPLDAGGGGARRRPTGVEVTTRRARRSRRAR